jgi:23S rRNA (pseudouridine1915-N3)-methyltransferase
MPRWVTTGFAEYVQRMPRDARVELIEIKPEKRAAGISTQRVLEREAQRIESALVQPCTRIVLDERGAQLTSVRLARELAAWRSLGRDLAFLIGGADGLDARLKSQAQALLALSAMTLPHALARVMLAEQLYRAHTIATGHPYHRD